MLILGILPLRHRSLLETLLACIELDATSDASGGNYAKNEEARIRYEDMRDDEDGMA